MFVLDPVDHLFADHLLMPYKATSEPAHLFLATLFHASRLGHLCIYLDEEKCLPECDKEPHDMLWKGVNELPLSLFEHEIVHVDNRFYLRRLFEAEEKVVKHLMRLKKAPLNVKPFYAEEKELIAEQRDAIGHVFTHPFTLLTGGPGTGKSFTAKEILRLFLESYPEASVAAIAPTGKAASNLRRGIGALTDLITVETIHRFLLNEPFRFDLVIVDEASMVDATLMGELMAHLKAGSRLVLIGDSDQLPPVEGGTLFSALVDLEKENLFSLKRSFRAETSEVIELAEKVRSGHLPPFLPLPNPENLVDLIQKKRAHLSSFSVLTPFRHGPYGVERLNNHLFQIAREKTIPIMITKNDPDLQLSNGDLAQLFPEKKVALFADKREISQWLLPAFELAYVLSIHKSQGSEYEEVMVLLPESSETFGRELLYTAITRAKKRVTIYAQNEKTVQGILSNQSKRLTGPLTNGIKQPLLPHRGVRSLPAQALCDP